MRRKELGFKSISRLHISILNEGGVGVFIDPVVHRPAVADQPMVFTRRFDSSRTPS
jgi:hypothetical protein